MCGGRKFEYGMDPLLMFRVDARTAVKIPDLQKGRVIAFVNCMECGYYMFFKPEVVGIVKGLKLSYITEIILRMDC